MRVSGWGQVVEETSKEEEESALAMEMKETLQQTFRRPALSNHACSPLVSSRQQSRRSDPDPRAWNLGGSFLISLRVFSEGRKPLQCFAWRPETASTELRSPVIPRPSHTEI